jgi:hypothetical protein
LNILVIGNATGNVGDYIGKTVICFNDFDECSIDGYDKLIRIENGRKHRKNKDFIVSGADERFYDTLLSSAHSLEQKLHCWPSSGLACLLALSRLGLTFSACKFSFSPTMTRINLDKRQAKPSSYHNWLGERRLALALCPNSLSAIEFIDAENTPRQKDICSKEMANDPFILLLSPKLDFDLLAKLADTTLSCWLASATQEKLYSIEHLFYLERNKKYSAKWWFFDDKAAYFVNNIFQKIINCQKACF